MTELHVSGKMAFFLPALTGGGAERVYLTFANHLAAKGYDVDFLLVQKKGAFIEELDKRVRIVELGGKGMARSFFPLLGYIRENRPDWVLSALTGPNLMALIARLCLKIKRDKRTLIAITEHVAFSEHKQKAITSKSLRTRVRFFLAGRLYHTADRVIAVSQGVADELVKYTHLKQDSVTIIPNPFDIEAIRERGDEAPGHPWLEDNNRAFRVIVSAGRLKPQKDFETLIRALQPIEDTRLIIIGEGEERDRLAAVVDELAMMDRVDLPGFADNPYSYFAHADLFVLSSHYEGFGNVIVEALAQGTPVVSSDCPFGPAEILDNGTYGRLVPPGDIAAMRQAVKDQLKTQKRGERDKQSRIERARDFDISVIADRYLAALKN